MLLQHFLPKKIFTADNADNQSSLQMAVFVTGNRADRSRMHFCPLRAKAAATIVARMSKRSSNSRHVETLPTDAPQMLSVPSADETDGMFRYQKLYQALNMLQEKEKAVIALFYFEDRSIKEIASILQIPSGTVKYHLSTARNHLKSILK